MTTIGQHLGRNAKRAIHNAVAEQNYGGGSLYAPLSFKDDVEDFGAPVKFEGFANVGGPDLGGDIVEPAAFTNAAISEYLKFGRQLLFMHDRYAQVGEITAAKRIAKNTRSNFGITEGGLYVEGFVDSPIDEELGMIPEHPLAQVIHFARMQVRKGRLKLLSIGWRPMKTELVKRPDPRAGGDPKTFRLVKQLLLGEVSLVTMAMSPQSMIELQKAYSEAYGDEITDALFAEEMTEEDLARVPEKVDDFSIDDLKRIASKADVAAEIARRKEATKEETNDETDAEGETKFNLVSLGSAPPAVTQRLNLTSLRGI